MKKALITGITGQDGSYLAEILLREGYEVHGLYRRSSTGNFSNIRHILPSLTLHQGDITDVTSLTRIIGANVYDEIYHEADQDNVDWSYKTVSYSMDVTAGAVGSLLETCRMLQQNAKIFIPTSATMFGMAEFPQNESTPFSPQSPYACAKAAAYYLAEHYRREYGMWINVAILYNHDSPRRHGDYLLHKICRGVARIGLRLQDTLELGNLQTVVDIGSAKDYMDVVWRAMQLVDPTTYVLGSDNASSIRTLVQAAFSIWGIDPTGRILESGSFHRPGLIPTLVADSKKIRNMLGYAEAEWRISNLLNELLIKYHRIEGGKSCD